ncbi:MAG: nucleotidyl transferase AbiEii/AbiGii toxin family protein [Kiritimatiellae bacterium]|jgi:hypothetical protein|nr:nucleotidyl transferase AbiEii/AbiGii toxin family protein [Kiritimatiellia bacterium]
MMPQNVSFLERAIRKLASSNVEAYRLRVMMANVIVGQFLENAVARGGTSMKLRYGNSTTRFTMDFDVARRIELEEFTSTFARRIEAGWGPFTGRLVEAGENHPKGVPQEYVMRPFDIKLQYRGHAWCTVRFEVSYDEIGDADEMDLPPVPQEILGAFSKLELPTPLPVPLMTIPFQVAQKLHGLTEEGSTRAQDLIDLQLMAKYETFDLKKIHVVCKRLFANRKRQEWPSLVVEGERWAGVYAEGANSIDGLYPTVSEAIAWVNDLIKAIDAAV